MKYAGNALRIVVHTSAYATSYCSDSNSVGVMSAYANSSVWHYVGSLQHRVMLSVKLAPIITGMIQNARSVMLAALRFSPDAA